MGASQHPGTAWGLSSGFFTRLPWGLAGSSCEPPKSISPLCRENRPPLSAGDGAPVPADKEPLDCADSPGAEVPAHPSAAF